MSDPHANDQVDEQYLRRLAQFAAEMTEFYDPEDAADMMFMPQKLLGDRRPADLLRTEEGCNEMARVIESLRDGAYV